MNAKHRRTLGAVFATPTLAGILFADVEALVRGLGGQVREGRVSRVAFQIAGRHLYLHRPHPGKNARRYQIEEVRAFLIAEGIEP